MAKATGTAGLEAACLPIAERMGYELVDVALEKEPTGKYLRFYIDKEAGVTLDDCEAFHKAVRQLADAVDYDFMEVSSPGIDRPLKKDRDFERSLGSEIENVVPIPSSLSTLRRPPWSRTIRSTIISPRPVPRSLVVK